MSFSFVYLQVFVRIISPCLCWYHSSPLCNSVSSSVPPCLRSVRTCRRRYLRFFVGTQAYMLKPPCLVSYLFVSVVTYVPLFIFVHHLLWVDTPVFRCVPPYLRRYLFVLPLSWVGTSVFRCAPPYLRRYLFVLPRCPRRYLRICRYLLSPCVPFYSPVPPCATFFLRRYLRVQHFFFVGISVYRSVPPCFLRCLRVCLGTSVHLAVFLHRVRSLRVLVGTFLKAIYASVREGEAAELTKKLADAPKMPKKRWAFALKDNSSKDTARVSHCSSGSSRHMRALKGKILIYIIYYTDRFCRVRVISVGCWICYRTGG